MDNQKEISVLNDLLHITNDRMEGFEKVEGKVWEMYPDVKDEYDHMISQSKIMKNELINLITEKQGNPENSTSIAGAIHRTWIDIKNSFTMGNLVESTLGNVVFGEKAAIEAYQNAMDSGDLSEKGIKTVSEQLRKLKDSYQQFKKIEEYKKKEE
ncbi:MULTISPECIES: PA2169 family four-helix-bundle protein [unclassified Chryseobacterium]|uniref:PA2169 family four-helix-bundle protein n=1 Tax=unclassified Chryseobacterium TaxID=2593645 RepID=UPI00285353A6|nr:PA2169 family four-helix-bundle protein [Chryseobacterium sp. CFS7]MDR4892196.1 PA2169 family four-helix-bundle protein [Chryseobacterium sp. CFS7]